MITTVLFDLDGLLIDSETVYYQMAEEMVTQHGIPFTLKQYVDNHAGRTLADNIQRYIDLCGISMTVEEGLQWTWAREAELTENGIPLKAGARELLRYLKEHGYKILLATSSLPDRAERLLRQNGVLDYFDDYVSASDVSRGKPDPEIFLTAARKAKEEPAHCLVLEDSENGIYAAHAGGFPVICVPDLKYPGEEALALTTAVVKSLDEVIPLLAAL